MAGRLENTSVRRVRRRNYTVGTDGQPRCGAGNHHLLECLQAGGLAAKTKHRRKSGGGGGSGETICPLVCRPGKQSAASGGSDPSEGEQYS
jgi:hypothetical protein